MIKIKTMLKYIYHYIPEWYRYGKVYRDSYKLLCDSSNWDEEDIIKYQLKNTKDMLIHAYESVPYYKRIFDENNFNPYNFHKFSQLEDLPYLTKDIIRENSEDLISKKYNRSTLKKNVTGGTTGMPMTIYIDEKYELAVERAFTAFIWKNIGYNPKKSNKSIIIRGNKPKNGLYEYNGRNLILSGYDIKEDNLRDYIFIINKYKADYIQAYPSFIVKLAELIIKGNYVLTSTPKAIICASENLTENQIYTIEQAFKTRVYSFYGHSEHSVMATQTSNSRIYEIVKQYGYTEFVKKQEYSSDDKELMEIVCTGFINKVMPFIRYKTNDLCLINENKDILRIEGREQEFFVDSLGNRVSYIYHDVPIWEVREKIDDYQYFQNTKGRVILKLKQKSNLSEYDLESIKNIFSKYYSNIELEFLFVDKIERSSSGKFKYLIQEI